MLLSAFVRRVLDSRLPRRFTIEPAGHAVHRRQTLRRSDLERLNRLLDVEPGLSGELLDRRRPAQQLVQVVGSTSGDEEVLLQPAGHAKAPGAVAQVALQLT